MHGLTDFKFKRNWNSLKYLYCTSLWNRSCCELLVQIQSSDTVLLILLCTVPEALLRTKKHASLQEIEDNVFEETLQCTVTTTGKLHKNSIFIHYSTFVYFTKIIQGYADKLITSADRYTHTFTCYPLLLSDFNPLNAELNPICYLLALLGDHHFLHVCRIRVKSLTLRLLMSYIYIYVYDISILRLKLCIASFKFLARKCCLCV